MTRIRLENIAKTFGVATVIKGLNLTIGEGEFFTFVGPSGCGKSTILNMIAGLDAPTDGLIFFNEKPVLRLSPKERDVAMVFQSYALYPHMTVRNNIAFPLVMRKERQEFIEAEVLRMAGLLGLAGLLEKKPKDLSGGQRQRVALGRAIIRKPRVFLMDEPLSNLDARLRIEMRSELKKLHRDLGITTIYVTHDQAEAMSLSDRIAVLNEGGIQQCDTPREVYQNPANIFVAGFIGSPPMNILRCFVKQEKPLIVDCHSVILSLPVTVPPGTGELFIGIRPEDSLIEGMRREGGSVVTVSVVESAGPVNWVDVVWEGVKFKGMSRPADDIQPGGKAFLTFSSERISVFDSSSGCRL